jgi:asparagine synthase (glutamine-hydrolysing)
MCGICGVINFNGIAPEAESLQIMMSAMKHRGPDDEGTYIKDNVGLGFVRLSIIDLSSAGHQPMISNDNRYAIIFNGEIFNYIELQAELISKGHFFNTKTDTEVLLHAYMEWGEDCLHHLNGMWAFVIYDQFEKKLFGARDRYGIKPFYYYLSDKQFIFASEIPSIMRAAGKKAEPNNLAIFDYLVFSRTDHLNETFFKDVYRLQHGWKINCYTDQNTKEGSGKGGIKLSNWYDLAQNLKPPFQEASEFREMLYSAIELRLRSDVPVGVCLSGGLDSSTIVSVMLQQFNFQDLNTFSATYRSGQFGDETKFINEYRPLVKKMHFINPSAESLEEDLYHFIRAHAEPIPTTSPYAQFKVMEIAKDHVVVTLDGQGADELLAGYHYFYGFYFKELLLNLKWRKLLNEIYVSFRMHRSLYPIKTFLFFLLPKSIMTRVRLLEKGYISENFYKQNSRNSSVTEKIYGSKSLKESLIDHFNYKLEHLLKWEDRNSMWFSLEARVPFLDHRLVEHTLSMPSDTKIDKGWTKAILRESMKGILPETIRFRKDKIGFGTPEDEWFRTDFFRDFVLQMLNSKSFVDRNIIHPKKAEKIYHDHLKLKANHSSEIWKWINLEIWFREFIDD